MIIIPGQYSRFVNGGYFPVLLGRFTTGNPDVFIQIFELFDSPAQSGVEIPLTVSGCTEVFDTAGAGTGRYTWSSVNLPTQPLNRLSLLYVMHASGTSFDGKVIIGSPEADGITSNFPPNGFMPNAGEGVII